METSRIMTVSVAGALTTTPFTPSEFRIPASVPVPLIVIPFPIVTAPKPPGSSTEISPPVEVLESAPANVLHGAVRLQGLASLPTPDTQERVWPKVVAAKPATRTAVRRRRWLGFIGFVLGLRFDSRAFARTARVANFGKSGQDNYPLSAASFSPKSKDPIARLPRNWV